MFVYPNTVLERRLDASMRSLGRRYSFWHTALQSTHTHTYTTEHAYTNFSGANLMHVKNFVNSTKRCTSVFSNRCNSDSLLQITYYVISVIFIKGGKQIICDVFVNECVFLLIR